MTPKCCPLCPSERTKRKGFDAAGRQRYACLKCDVVWTAETWEKRRTKGARILQAIRMVEQGAFIKDAAVATGFSNVTVAKYLKIHRGQGDSRRAG